VLYVIVAGLKFHGPNGLLDDVKTTRLERDHSVALTAMEPSCTASHTCGGTMSRSDTAHSNALAQMSEVQRAVNKTAGL
jgi:hypothetical protein